MVCHACHYRYRSTGSQTSPFRQLCRECGYKALELVPATETELIAIHGVLRGMGLIQPLHTLEAVDNHTWDANFAVLFTNREC